MGGLSKRQKCPRIFPDQCWVPMGFAIYFRKEIQHYDSSWAKICTNSWDALINIYFPTSGRLMIPSFISERSFDFRTLIKITNSESGEKKNQIQLPYFADSQFVYFWFWMTATDKFLLFAAVIDLHTKGYRRHSILESHACFGVGFFEMVHKKKKNNRWPSLGRQYKYQ